MHTLITQAQMGDKTARDKFIEENFGLVKSIAWRFRGRGTDFEDLCQIGAIGLIKAVQRFDVNAGFCFSTYAVHLITGEIKRHLRDDGMIKVSRSLKELGIKAYAMYEKLEKEGRSVTVAQLAEEMNVDTAELSSALDAVKEVKSLNDKNDDGRELIDVIAQPYAEAETRILIENMLDTLSERDKKLVILRYFKGKTQSETAKLLDISQVQVSRCEKKILKKLRAEIM